MHGKKQGRQAHPAAPHHNGRYVRGTGVDAAARVATRRCAARWATCPPSAPMHAAPHSAPVSPARPAPSQPCFPLYVPLPLLPAELCAVCDECNNPMLKSGEIAAILKTVQASTGTSDLPPCPTPHQSSRGAALCECPLLRQASFHLHLCFPPPLNPLARRRRWSLRRASLSRCAPPWASGECRVWWRGAFLGGQGVSHSPVKACCHCRGTGGCRCRCCCCRRVFPRTSPSPAGTTCV